MPPRRSWHACRDRADQHIRRLRFEPIHPFPDGNGRTGRALVRAMLRAGG